MHWVAHPTDARLKCLAVEQVHHLARLHGRPLQMPAASCADEATALDASQGQTPAAEQNEALLVSAASCLPEEQELRKAICDLQATVMTLQEQLTQLTLELLRERQDRYEGRLSALEALVPQSTRMAPSPQERPLLPAHSRIIARVEYGAQGLYVLICPRQGELSFTTDSQQWFDWLASLTSFRFVGPQGRFTAYREGLRRSWKAYRTFHGHSYRRSLGTTDCLSIAHLEQVAATLLSDMT